MPIGSYLIYNIEKEYHSYIKPPDQVDGILILGGATNPLLYNEYDQISLNGSSERLVESVFIIKKFDKAKVIFSGGSGILNSPNFDHAQVAKSFYKKIGIEIDKIIFEDNSRNTYENIIYSKKIANPKINENWLLITSASHMKRALLIADKNNWKLIPYAVDFKNINFDSSVTDLLLPVISASSSVNTELRCLKPTSLPTVTSRRSAAYLA